VDPTERALRLALAVETDRLRQQLRDDPGAALPRLDPVRFSGGFDPAGPQAAVLRAYHDTPPVGPGRTPYQVLVEGYRGLGKTEIAREMALQRLLDGSEVGVLYVGRTPPDGAAHVASYLDRIPPLRRREDPRDPAVATWRVSPLGRLYPDARITGGVEHAEIHVSGRVAHVWSRPAGGSIRGINVGGVRPSLVIPDDLVTLEAALSAKQTATLTAIVDDDIGGLGTISSPIAIWLLGNAIAQDDLLDRAARSGRWRVVRVAAWTPHLPPQSAEKNELLRLLCAPGGEEPALAYYAAHEAAILGGARPTDPSVHPLILLRIEAARGTAAFRRAYQCERLAADDRLLPMERAVLVERRGHELLYPDGTRLDLATCRAGIWLDPRGIEDAARGDFAAVAICVREPGAPDRARRAVLDVQMERCSASGQRAMLWEMLDRALSWGIRPGSIRLGYETNNAAKLAHETFFDQESRARRAAGLHTPAIEGSWSSKDKYGIERIGGLEGPILTGRLAFAAHLRTSEAWTQLERAPHADHDDAPDAIAQADGLTATIDPAAAADLVRRTMAAYTRRV